MPSLYEPFGIAPLEAMSYELPWVVTNGWALEETVVQGQTGELVECGCVDNLVEKLLLLLRNLARLREMGAQGRKRVIEAHTWDKIVGHMKTIIAGLQCS